VTYLALRLSTLLIKALFAFNRWLGFGWLDRNREGAVTEICVERGGGPLFVPWIEKRGDLFVLDA
jgi:hypothetical protein